MGIDRAMQVPRMRMGRSHMGESLSLWKPPTGAAVSEPLGPQQGSQEVDEQQQHHQGSEPDHGNTSYTRSQATTKANNRAIVTRPSRNSTGIQTVRSIANPSFSGS